MNVRQAGMLSWLRLARDLEGKLRRVPVVVRRDDRAVGGDGIKNKKRGNRTDTRPDQPTTSRMASKPTGLRATEQSVRSVARQASRTCAALIRFETCVQ